ncbi:MAG: glycosyltransferase family 39 protein [Candidatus Firestonebacteria bacterium]
MNVKLIKNKKVLFILLVLIILCGVILRFFIIRHDIAGDEAVFGLMAKHIMEGREYPLYMWEAHYSGTLSAYIIAISFKIFGVSSFSYKIAGLLLFIPYIIFIYMLAKKIFDSNVGLLSTLFVAVSPVFVSIYLATILGVYIEGLICGTIILLLCCYIVSSEINLSIFMLLGFVSGLGLWLSPHVVPFFITALIVIVLKFKKDIFSKYTILLLIFFIVGYLPAIIYNFYHPTSSFYHFAGRVLELNRSVLLAPDFNRIVFSKIIWRISTVPGSLINMYTLILPLIGLQKYITNSFIIWSLIIIIYLSSFVYIIYLRKKLLSSKVLPLDVLFIFVIIFVLFYCFFVGEFRSRYLLPLSIVLPIILSVLFLNIKKISNMLFYVLLVFVLSVNFAGVLNNIKLKSISYDNLVSFLEENKLLYGYSEYFTSYPIVFKSSEKIIVSPCAVDSISERYPLYTNAVHSASDIFYVFNLNTHPQVIALIEQRLKILNISYKRKYIYPFIVYYKFSRIISPNELKLELKSPCSGIITD